MKRILVVAGSDSSGGAGLEADQKVIAAHGCYAMTATAALTAQNTLGVNGIHETPPSFVQQQIEACLDDIGADVLKTGMLASAETIAVVANAIRHFRLPITVIDPVMVSTSGAQLLPEKAVRTLIDELLPRTTILTPNIPEANLILLESGQAMIEIKGLESIKRLATALQSLGPKFVLLKGGHCPLTDEDKVSEKEEDKRFVANVLIGSGSVEVIKFPYQKTKHTHGTGCSLASALACNLASGLDMVQAVHAASRYVNAGIRTAIPIGSGSAPINHFHSLQMQPFPPGGFVDYILERPDVQPAWYAYTHHDFCERMGDGTLPLEAFKDYMIQDYLYLTHFARANALAAYKTKHIDDIAASAEIVLHIKREMELHIDECKAFGITKEMIAEHQENLACTAYSRYVLDIGQSEDWLALQFSLMPCLLGYGIIARRLKNHSAEGNRYQTWIDNYVAADYIEAVRKGCELVEKHAFKQSPSRVEELVNIFVMATKLETGFWNMCMPTSERHPESIATAALGYVNRKLDSAHPDQETASSRHVNGANEH